MIPVVSHTISQKKSENTIDRFHKIGEMWIHIQAHFTLFVFYPSLKKAYVMDTTSVPLWFIIGMQHRIWVHIVQKAWKTIGRNGYHQLSIANK